MFVNAFVDANFRYLYSFLKNELYVSEYWLFTQGEGKSLEVLHLFPPFCSVDEAGTARIIMDGHFYDWRDLEKAGPNASEYLKKLLFDEKQKSSEALENIMKVTLLGTITRIVDITILAIDETKCEITIQYSSTFSPLAQFIQKKFNNISNRWRVSTPLIKNDDVLSKQEIEIIDLWNKSYTAKEIASIISLSSGRVINLITELRKKLGEDKVPYHSSSMRKRRDTVM